MLEKNTSSMAYKSLRMDLIDKITELHSNGVPKKRIARILGLSKNTVKKYLKKAGAVEQYTQMSAEENRRVLHGARTDTEREEVLRELLPHINRELGRTGVTRQLLWEEYKNKHPDGFSYGRFCDRIRAYRQVQNATIRLQHRPGYHMMVDFTGKKVHWVDKRTGEQIGCEVLVCVLPYSGYCFACAVPRQSQDDFVWGINRALLFIGGLPQVILSDNLKSFVKKSDRYEPVFTEFCAQFAGHYGVELQASRVATDYPGFTKAVILLSAGGMVAAPADILSDLRKYIFGEYQNADERLDLIQRTMFSPKSDVRSYPEMSFYPKARDAQIQAIRSTPLEAWWYAGSAPVLIIQGLDDRVAVPENGRLLKQQLGERAQLVEIEDAGHFLHLEKPGQVEESIINYLNNMKG